MGSGHRRSRLVGVNRQLLSQSWGWGTGSLALAAGLGGGSLRSLAVVVPGEGGGGRSWEGRAASRPCCSTCTAPVRGYQVVPGARGGAMAAPAGTHGPVDHQTDSVAPAALEVCLGRLGLETSEGELVTPVAVAARLLASSPDVLVLPWPPTGEAAPWCTALLRRLRVERRASGEASSVMARRKAG
jgi:hypothetical protein